jgi:rfaE bifunctional protein nucleotidyltransferase chain/domain
MFSPFRVENRHLCTPATGMGTGSPNCEAFTVITTRFLDTGDWSAPLGNHGHDEHSGPLVLPASELAGLVRRWRAQGEVVALCQGCFDPVHLGHVLHFREVLAHGSRLVVGVGADAYVRRGEGRPLLPDRLRARMVAELRVVDAVTVNDASNAEALIRTLRPDVFAKGIDYAGSADPGLLAEQDAIAAVGGRFVVTGSPKFSATALAAAVTEWK